MSSAATKNLQEQSGNSKICLQKQRSFILSMPYGLSIYELLGVREGTKLIDIDERDYLRPAS